MQEKKTKQDYIKDAIFKARSFHFGGMTPSDLDIEKLENELYNNLFRYKDSSNVESKENLYWSEENDKAFLGEDSEVVFEKSGDSLKISYGKESKEVSHINIRLLIDSFWPTEKKTRTNLLSDSLNDRHSGVNLVSKDMQELIEISRLEAVLNEKIKSFKSRYALKPYEWKDAQQTIG